MWDPIVSVPDHCVSFYFSYQALYHLEEGGFNSRPMVDTSRDGVGPDMKVTMS